MSKTRLNKGERRQQLIEAALRAFGQRGYHGTQISHIIAEAGVARGTFYLYFQGKRAIFDEILHEIFNRVVEVMQPINKEDIQKVPGEILGNIERATKLLIDNPIYPKILFSDAVGLDPDFDDRLKKYYQLILEKIRGGLEHGQAMGIVREGDTQILSLCLMGSLKEILYQYFLGTCRPPVEQINREVYHLVLAAAVKPELVQALSS